MNDAFKMFYQMTREELRPSDILKMFLKVIFCINFSSLSPIKMKDVVKKIEESPQNIAIDNITTLIKSLAIFEILCFNNTN